MMRAITYKHYGSPDVLELVDVELPEPGAGQVLVRVLASSINASDYRLMRADPWLSRIQNGVLAPRKWPILGSDFAGVVEAVGPGVQGYKPGDAVFGNCFPDGLGAFADYVCVNTTSITSKPEHISFQQAAATPLAALTALQAVRDMGAVTASSRVLIYGAGGGVGNFAVQIAAALGAHVTAVCSQRSADLVRGAGAHEVIDYRTDDFMNSPGLFDVILGVNGYRSLRDYKQKLSAGGRYVAVGGTSGQIFGALLLAPFVFAGSSKRAMTLTIDESKRAEDIGLLGELLARGEIFAHIDRVFPLDQARAAFEYVEGGHVHGKVILSPTS